MGHPPPTGLIVSATKKSGRSGHPAYGEGATVSVAVAVALVPG